MRTAVPLTFVCSAALLAAAAGSAHAQSWTPPEDISTGMPAGTPTLAFDGRGWALATWADRLGGRRSASRPPAATAFRPQRRTPDPGEEVVEGPRPRRWSTATATSWSLSNGGSDPPAGWPRGSR